MATPKMMFTDSDNKITAVVMMNGIDAIYCDLKWLHFVMKSGAIFKLEVDSDKSKGIIQQFNEYHNKT